MKTERITLDKLIKLIKRRKRVKKEKKKMAQIFVHPDAYKIVEQDWDFLKERTLNEKTKA